MYKYTDKIIRYLNERYVELFSRLKGLASIDELNVIGSVNALYAELNALVRRMYLEIAKHAYQAQRGGDLCPINEIWLNEFLEAYDPVTKYVFTHEVDRKRARLIEAMIASGMAAAEVDSAMRSWSLMSTQYAVEINDAANLQALKDSGVQEVVWMTEPDDRRCKECLKRDGQVYNIDNVPSKPHIGCRCYLVSRRNL